MSKVPSIYIPRQRSRGGDIVITTSGHRQLQRSCLKGGYSVVPDVQWSVCPHFRFRSRPRKLMGPALKCLFRISQEL